MDTKALPARPLLRILGLGFGLAMAFGGTVGVGILRLPGTVAAALGDARAVMLVWGLGGVYAVFGAVSIAELAAMLPEAGGFRVYARRAFGEGAGFVIGWSDWLCCAASVAFAAVTAATFLAELWPAAGLHPRVVATAVLALFTGLHWTGLRLGRTITGLISVAVGLMLMALVVGCFVVTPAAPSSTPPSATSAASMPLLSVGMLAALVTALRSVLVAYDGWYAPIYFAEESTQPARTLPRAILGGALLVAALFLALNLGLLRVLPVPVLAASTLPVADAAGVVFARGGALFVTVSALLTVLCLTNALLLETPRVLYAIGRDGLFSRRAALVSAGGTPRVALGVTSAVIALLVVTGSFEQIVALNAVLFLLCYVSSYAAVFVLRVREPGATRPYRALGYPVTTAIVLAGSALFLAAAVIEDPRTLVAATVLVGACAPAYRVLARRRALARS